MAESTMRDGFEVLMDGPMINKGRKILRAMMKAAPRITTSVEQYEGRRKVLIVYGAGAIWRQSIIRIHQEAGGRVVCLDLAYWDKGEAMRFAVDGKHPAIDHIERTASTGRPFPELRSDGNPDGPVILIGMSGKGRTHYGFNRPTWEVEKLKELSVRFPGRQVLYRKKGSKPDEVHWAPAPDGEICECIKGAALIVCRHSNCAVDACIAGVPVECDGGAAKWLYRRGPDPTEDQRRDFLGRLAHWQYDLHEAAECWDAIQGVLECAST